MTPRPSCGWRPDRSAVAFDYRAADQQPHAHSTRPGATERVEDPPDACGSMSIPVPRTAISTCPGNGLCDRIANSRGRPSTEAMASASLSSRFMITCCSCTQLPSTTGSVGASSRRSYPMAEHLLLHQRDHLVDSLDDVQRHLLGSRSSRKAREEDLACPPAIIDEYHQEAHAPR